MNDRPIIVENVTQWPKSAAKVAAAFLVLTSLPVTPQKDVKFARQAKVFVEQESYIQPQRGCFVTVISPAPYSPAKDVRRRPQDKTFIEQESFVQPQRGYLLATLAANAIPSQIQISVINHVTENVSWVKQQRGTAVVLAQVAPIVQNSDIFISQDTYGWPPDPIDFFSPGQRGTNAVLNSFPVYNPATDVRRRPQDKTFVEGDSFVQQQHINYVVNNTFPYNPGTDAARLRPQAKVFVEGDAFIRPRAPLSNSIKFTPYAFATDVRRAKQQQVSQEVDTFTRPLPFNELVTNGTAAPPVSASIVSIELEVVEAMRGTINLAWTPFPYSDLVTYQIYINEVPVVSGITTPRTATIAGLVVDTDYFIKIIGFPQLGFPRQSNQVFYRYGTTEIQYYTVPSGPLPAPDV